MSAIYSKPASSIISLALAMGLMLSPESLVILGNAMGIAGVSFLLFIMSAMVIHLFTALSYGEVYSLYKGAGSEARIIKDALGSIPAIVLPICSRVVFTVCASTGILATAGYVFNEVLVNWFPNLGFSFCLLGFLVLINLWNQRVTEMVQIMLVTVAICGLTFLSAVGFIGLESTSPVVKVVDYPSFDLARLALLGLVLFIGFDLAGLVSNNENKYPLAVSRMIAAMAAQGLLPSFLGLAQNRAPIPLIILAVGIAAMMASGMAGVPDLEIYTRAGVLFWLLNYSAVHLSVLIMRRGVCGRLTQFQIPGFPVVTLIGFLVLFLGFFGLLWSDSESALLFKFMLIILVIVCLFSTIWVGLTHRKSRLTSG
ncbi:MAG: hypothetical protein JRF22_07600 [Deltaproteobacteria bacterium]|nr:hypothetical protein [Deltaproteobacteria bacterium]